MEGPAGEEQRGFDDVCKFVLLDLQPVLARSWGRSHEAIFLRPWLSFLSKQLFPCRGMTVKGTGLELGQAQWCDLHRQLPLCPCRLLRAVRAVLPLPPSESGKPALAPPVTVARFPSQSPSARGSPRRQGLVLPSWTRRKEKPLPCPPLGSEMSLTPQASRLRAMAGTPFHSRASASRFIGLT